MAAHGLRDSRVQSERLLGSAHLCSFWEVVTLDMVRPVGSTVVWRYHVPLSKPSLRYASGSGAYEAISSPIIYIFTCI